MSAHLSATAPVADGKGVRLPKLDVPTFEGDVLHWAQFWEQFKISIHDRSHLSNAEKLVYLQQVVTNGSAKSGIEGLSCSGDNYKEAIDCLKICFNHPCLLHCAHLRKIVEDPSLKDGSGKELRRLHDVIQQRLRALKAMGAEPDESFITSVIELKLNIDTMFEHGSNTARTRQKCPHTLRFLSFWTSNLKRLRHYYPLQVRSHQGNQILQ